MSGGVEAGGGLQAPGTSENNQSKIDDQVQRPFAQVRDSGSHRPQRWTCRSCH